MRHVGDLPTEQQAQKFVDYLLVEGIKTQFEQEGDRYALWVIEEDAAARIKEELELFCENPNDSRYQGHHGKADQQRKAEEKAAREFKKRQVDVRTRWRGNGTGVKAGPVTKSLIGISILVALLTGLGTSENEALFLLLFEKLQPVQDGFLRSGTTAIMQGEVWRIFTPMFIHFGPLHILFNMMWLYQLGNQMEPRLGQWKYLIIVLVISGISNYGEFAWAQWNNHFSIFGGMSGVVYGMLGYIWMRSRYLPEERYFLPQQTIMFMLGWLVLCMTGMMGNIANAAHLIGLIAGCAIGYAPVILGKK
jgi:GlpG protein